MEFLELAKLRKSIRGYSDGHIKESTLRYILECARMAPSSANKQVWRFIVVQNKELREEIVKACPFFNKFMASASVIIVACAAGPSSRHNDQDYYLVDVAIAMEHLVLAAAEQGLGTCWIAAFDGIRVKEALGMPEKARVVAITPLGYPAGEKLLPKAMGFITKLRGRKKLGEIAFRDKWESSF